VRAKIKFIAIALVCCALGVSTWLGLQWWPSHAPQDYEECSESAGKTASSNDERASLLAQCDKQFVGRRRPGGGYTYYDFLQDRRFEIAGPNPTPQELKKFDEEYILYLNAQRQDAVAATLPQRQRAETDSQSDQSATGSLSPAGSPLAIAPSGIAPGNVPIPIPRPSTQIARSQAQRCEDGSLSCNWTKFSAGIKSFFGSYAKVNRP
jgi:hypothetical protein